MIKKLLLLSVVALGCQTTSLKAQDFNKYFTENTLRINCIFGGNANEQHIFVDNMNSIPGWYGRKTRLGEFPVEGNAQFEMRDHKTGKVIYRNSLSTLFQEWQTYDEARTSNKSFENVILMPMPKDSAEVTIKLKNNRRETVASITDCPQRCADKQKGQSPYAIRRHSQGCRHLKLHQHCLPCRRIYRNRNGEIHQ